MNAHMAHLKAKCLKNAWDLPLLKGDFVRQSLEYFNFHIISPHCQYEYHLKKWSISLIPHKKIIISAEVENFNSYWNSLHLIKILNNYLILVLKYFNFQVKVNRAILFTQMPLNYYFLSTHGFQSDIFNYLYLIEFLMVGAAKWIKLLQP